MKIIKKINNNVAIGIDSHHREVIVFGKGIGFPSIPYDLNDLSKIDRTFYDIDQQYLGLIEEIPPEIFDISADLVDYAILNIDKVLNPNIVFTLADHIYFAIKRYKNNMNFKLPFIYDLQYLYEKEMNVGTKGVELINNRFKLHLPKDEAVGIAMHFINAENNIAKKSMIIDSNTFIEQITKIIENDFKITIDKSGFNYSRFVSHMHYLLKRQVEYKDINSENKVLFNLMKNNFSQSYETANHINNCFKKIYKYDLSQEELLYLMLHINRLCSHEDDKQ